MFTPHKSGQNPFMPGNGIEPRYLAGRADILEFFSKALESYTIGLPHNLVIFGLRGTGKTVLLKYFKALGETKNWLCVEREFNERYCDDYIFAEAFVKDLLSMASEASIQKKILETGKNILDTLKPEEISAYGISYRPFYREKRELLEDYLKEMLVSNWHIFKKARKNGLIFLYDEFHSVRDKPESAFYTIASILSAMAYAQKNGCKYYLVLSGLPIIKANLKESKTYAERMFSFKEIGYLSPKQAKEAIVGALKGSGHVFDEALTDAIVKETGGYPYFIQFYGYFLIENSKKSKLTIADMNRLNTSLLEELDASFFEDRFNLASNKEREIMLSMAKYGDGAVPAIKIRKMSKVSHPVLMELLKRLQEKGLVYRSSRGKYEFSIPLFRQYILRKCKHM